MHHNRISLRTILSLLLAAVLLIGTLAACQPGQNPPDDTSDSTTDPTTDPPPEENTTWDPEQTTPGEEGTTNDEILQPDDPTYEVAKNFKDVLISAVYGTGQNMDAAVGHGFIQLYNVGTESVSLKDAALYYREDAGDDYRQMAFADDATIAPGGFFLIRMAAARENNGQPYDESFAVLRIDSYDAEWAVILDNKDIQLSLAPAGQEIDKTCAVEDINGTVSYFVATELGGYDSPFAVDNMSKSKVAVRTALKHYSGFHKVNLNEATTAQLWQVCPASAQGENAVVGSKVNEVLFSADAGIYEKAFSLTLSAKEGYKIYYTTDGTDPKAYGKQYTGAIKLSDSSAMSLGPTTNGAIASMGEGYRPQSKTLPGGHVIKAYATNGTDSTDVFTNTYFISETFYDYGVTLMSLSMDKYLVYGSEGFYNHYYSTGGGGNTRQTGMLEVFSADGERRGSSYVELAISGHGSSGWAMKSMRVYYKSANNTAVGTDGDLNYDLFDGYARDNEGHAITDFSRLLLRNSGNDCMNSFIRDAYMQRVCRDMDVHTMAYAPVLLFINGEFWGVYNARERYSPEYVESHYGVNKDNVALVESDYDALVLGGNPGAPFIPMDGTQEDADEFNQLVDYIRTHDLSVDEHYQYVADRLDVNSFMDMYVARLFFSARDWPENNIKVFKNRDANDPSGMDTKWYFTLLDMDMGISFFTDGNNTQENANFFGWIDSTGTVIGTIMHNLCKNQGFKQQFLTRFATVVNEVLTPEFMTEELDIITEQREPLVKLQTMRWGASESAYRTSVSNMYRFVQNRKDYVINQLCAYFGISPSDLEVLMDKSVVVTYNPSRAEVKLNGQVVSESGQKFEFEAEDKTTTFTVSATAKAGYTVGSIMFIPISGQVQTVQGATATFTVDCSGTVVVNTTSDGQQDAVAGVQSGITASGHSMYYLAPNGDLYAWGMNPGGILGIPGGASVSIPTCVATNVAKVEVCHSNDCENNNNNTVMAYLTLDGKLYTVGNNSAGQLGRNGTTSDDKLGLVMFSKKIVDVSVGYDHLLVLDEDGMLWGVGSNTHGQLGKSHNGGTTTTFQVVASDVKLLAAGRRNTFYTDKNNTCFVLGDNRWNKFGTDADAYSTPHELLRNVVYMSTGEHQVVLVNKSGDLYYAGWRSLQGFGQGQGAGGAVKVTGGVKKAVLHHSNMIILKTDGSVWGYGSNMGNAMAGVSATSGTPVKILSGGVVDIASGYEFSAYLLKDGTITVQGSNTSGQAGNGTIGGSVNMAQALF